jgi:hypothetical protein
MHIQSKFGKISALFHLTVKENFGHMEQKEDLEDLVGACAVMNKILVELTVKKILYYS